MKQIIKESIKNIIGANNIRIIRELINKGNRKKIAKASIKEYEKDSFPFGINLIGSFTQDSGLGQSCRLLAKLIEKADIPHNFIDFVLVESLRGTNEEYKDALSDEYKYGINVFHINMHEFDRAFKRIGQENFDKHYNIAYWLWEMQEFPEEWVVLINLLDEIWTPSEFVSEAIRKVTDKPVYTIPYLLEAPCDDKYDRAYFNLPEDKFLYLMLFDSNSISERKNPIGTIQAFKNAFGEDKDNVGLVIKIGNVHDKELNVLQKELEGYHAYFINDNLSKIEVNSLIKCVDVYVSLHRCEGYGLVLSEAMLLKTPTIATNYSSNTEFQDESNSCLVNYELIKVGKDIYPYKKDYLWAEPNIEEASKYMKKLYENKDFYNSLVETLGRAQEKDIQGHKAQEMINERYIKIIE